MKATMMAHDAIKAGSVEITLPVEWNPCPTRLTFSKCAPVCAWVLAAPRMDHMFLDGLQDAETGRLMGSFAQDVANQKGYTREQMDEYAIALTRAKEGLKRV